VAGGSRPIKTRETTKTSKEGKQGKKDLLPPAQRTLLLECAFGAASTARSTALLLFFEVFEFFVTPLAFFSAEMGSASGRIEVTPCL
jgi:hypothetical protein